MPLILGAEVWQDGVMVGRVVGGRLPDMAPMSVPAIPIVAGKPFVVMGAVAAFQERFENVWRNLHPIPASWIILLPDGGEVNGDGIWGVTNIQWGRPLALEPNDIWRVAAQFQALVPGNLYLLEVWFGNDPYFGVAYRLVTDVPVVVGSEGSPLEAGALGIRTEINTALQAGLGVEPATTVKAGLQPATGVEVHILHHQDFQFVGANVEAWDGPTEFGPMTFLYLGNMAAGEERTGHAAYRVPTPTQETIYSWSFSAHAADRPMSAILERLTTVLGPNSLGAIGGGVFNPQDEPLPGANVTIVDLGRAQVTDQNGIFLFEDVPAGTYTVRATRPGYNPWQEVVTVWAQAIAYIRFVLTPVPGPAPGTGGKGLPPWVFLAGGLALLGGAVLGVLTSRSAEAAEEGG